MEQYHHSLFPPKRDPVRGAIWGRWLEGSETLRIFRHLSKGLPKATSQSMIRWWSGLWSRVLFGVALFFPSLSLGQFLSHQCYTWGSVLGTRLTLPFDHCYFSSTWARRDRLPFSAWLEREPSRLSNSSNTEYYVESWISQNFFASFALLRILHYPLAFPNYPVWINVWVEEMVS